MGTLLMILAETSWFDLFLKGLGVLFLIILSVPLVVIYFIGYVIMVVSMLIRHFSQGLRFIEQPARIISPIWNLTLFSLVYFSIPIVLLVKALVAITWLELLSNAALVIVGGSVLITLILTLGLRNFWLTRVAQHFGQHQSTADALKSLLGKS